MKKTLGISSLLFATGISLYMTACGGGGSPGNPHPSTPAAPSVTVAPSAASITTVQSASVKVTVSGASGMPSGSVVVSSASFTSGATALSAGAATMQIPAGSLAAGTATLTASYTPDASSSPSYTSASGTASLTVTKATPAITVTPASSPVPPGQSASITITVTGGNDAPAASGSVVLTAGSFTSAASPLVQGSAIIVVPATSLVSGSNAISAAYTPDTASSSIYQSATGTATVTVGMITVTVNQGVSGPAVSDKLLGMNMATWFDPTDPAVVPAFQAAGIKAVRWPGGSWSDVYHWKNNSLCGGTPNSNATYANFTNQVVLPAALDVALTANYGTNSTCDGPGDPQEAADWITNAKSIGGQVSYMTVGNEEYGSWETDKHAKPNDAATYADAAANAYYPAIKAADSSVLVGVDVNPGNQPDWDTTVLSKAKYDFVEYHYYPQAPGYETDTFLVQQAAPQLSTAIETLKSELAAAGHPDTPIYVGEIGSVYTAPGKQSWSITQGLYAGQALGEMMNQGVARLTWWIGFGNCWGSADNNSGSLYGWQNWGAYNVFSDGPSDSQCPNAGPAGTMSPTARAFQLFSNIAVSGEFALSAAVAGDSTDVRAYAATHSGGTALVLFNLNATTAQAVQVALSGQSSTSDISVITYDKSIYDRSKNNVWDSPVTTDLGASNLPLNLTLTPWSMNVVLIK